MAHHSTIVVLALFLVVTALVVLGNVSAVVESESPAVGLCVMNATSDLACAAFFSEETRTSLAIVAVLQLVMNLARLWEVVVKWEQLADAGHLLSEDSGWVRAMFCRGIAPARQNQGFAFWVGLLDIGRTISIFMVRRQAAVGDFGQARSAEVALIAMTIIVVFFATVLRERLSVWLPPIPANLAQSNRGALDLEERDRRHTLVRGSSLLYLVVLLVLAAAKGSETGDFQRSVAPFGIALLGGVEGALPLFVGE